jgi:hypothetical protein
MFTEQQVRKAGEHSGILVRGASVTYIKGETASVHVKKVKTSVTSEV